MCGIVGFYGEGDEKTLKHMVNTLRHRGPDACQTFYKPPVALGHTRLAILDLRPLGNQPMFSADKTLAIVFNGEIYNFPQLKKELQEKYTVNFQTNTDTEVLLYLYKYHGTKMLQKLNGMFAFAIYDFVHHRFFLARDRMGQKPLYYTFVNGHFIFASELKALIQHPLVKKKVDLKALNYYLTLDYVPTPYSILQNVYKLEAGHFLVVEKGKKIQHQAFWEPTFQQRPITFKEALQTLDQLLADSVRIRLLSDVPLGVFLSGGLDSSTVAYYAQKFSTQPIKTFSIGFKEKSYDESTYAERVAKHLGTEHAMEVLTPKKLLALVEEIYPMVDEPFADPSLIPTYFLSQFTRKHVTVALGGDGGDELFAGYPTFIAHYFIYPLAWFPKSVIQLLRKIANYLPVSDKNISLDFKIRQFLQGFLGNKAQIHSYWLGTFTPFEKEKLFKKEVLQALQNDLALHIVDTYYQRCNDAKTYFDKVLYLYYKTYLQDDILVKVDRASMYNALEARAPFLDWRVVTFVSNLPRRLKQKGLEGKFLLKRLMEKRLPREIVYRPKKGFGIPLSKWLREDLKKVVEEVLFKEDAFFHQDYLRFLFDQHLRRRTNYRKHLWNLFVFKRFCQYWGIEGW